MATYYEKLALREQGLTYAEIAKELGISQQAVQQSLGKHKESQFRGITAKQCIYKGLRNWMNENKVPIREIVRRTGVQPFGSACNRYAQYFRGKQGMSKRVIDQLLKITGLTYEQCFEVAGEEVKAD